MQTSKRPPARQGYKETSMLWSLSGSHIYDNDNLKTNELIDKALTELFSDGAVERMSR